MSSGTGERRGRWALLGSPLFAMSIALLLLNDHLLKAAWPGVVTGKLSDVAGVVMVAIALTAIIGSHRRAVAATTIGFAALKTVPAVAVWAAPVLGGVTRTDPTDLLALLALVPLSRWLAFEMSRTRLVGEPSLGRRIVLVSAAVFATTATSCAPGGVDTLWSVDGDVLASVQGEIWESKDGGASWQRTSLGYGDARLGRASSATCAGGRCFELGRGPDSAAVVEVVDGVELPLLEWNAADGEALAEVVDWSCEVGTFYDLVTVERDGEVSVVVSMTEAGTLRWSSRTESWSWVAIGGWGLEAERLAGIEVARPAADPTFFESTWPGRAVLVATTLATFAAAPLVGRLARSRQRPPGGYVAVVVGLGLLTLAPLFVLLPLATDWRTGDGEALLVVALVVAAVTGAAVAVVAGLAARRRSSLPPPDPGRRAG